MRLRAAVALAAFALLPGACTCQKAAPAAASTTAMDASAPAPRAEAPDAGPRGLAAVSTWPRMRADRFGCLLDRELGVRDVRFNCSTKSYENQGDLCKDPEVYYEGPAVPDSVVDRLHPRLTSIALDWEHGELQQVTLMFDGTMDEAEARALVGLPERGQPLPANVARVSLKRCSKTGDCLTLVGFEHTGAGDVNCPE